MKGTTVQLLYDLSEQRYYVKSIKGNVPYVTLPGERRVRVGDRLTEGRVSALGTVADLDIKRYEG